MCNNVKQDLDHPQLWAGVRFFFQLVNFLSCPLLSTDLVFSSLRKSATAKGLCRRFTTYIYWAEKQLAALCPQLHCLPAGNGMHESFIRGGEPLSVVSDLEICIRTQTHRKWKSTGGGQRLDIPRWWPQTHLHTPGWPGLQCCHHSTRRQKSWKHLCFNSSAENGFEKEPPYCYMFLFCAVLH